MPGIILENIRSCYNVGNIIRTADAFGFDIIISGYTPSPFSNFSVSKTSLGAEKNVDIYEFWNTLEALKFAKNKYGKIIAAEIVKNAKSLKNYDLFGDIGIVFGNEISGVLPETLEFVDDIIYIPMIGVKESLNVGQSAAIFMWEWFRKNI